jgi:hypothetical protein
VTVRIPVEGCPLGGDDRMPARLSRGGVRCSMDMDTSVVSEWRTYTDTSNRQWLLFCRD